jgi:peptide-methionine (S)-S-oxide reductase
LRTRVGYTGGLKKSPTYHDLGDHTESVQIDFIAAQTSYEKLLDVFWKNHSCSTRRSRQYMSAIWYHNENQEKLAKQSKQLLEASGKKIYTVIEPVKEFYLAEDYHQKYFLRGDRELFGCLNLESAEELAESTAAAKLNAVCGGYFKDLNISELSSFNLPPQVEAKVKRALEGSYFPANDGMKCGL